MVLVFMGLGTCIYVLKLKLNYSQHLHPILRLAIAAQILYSNLADGLLASTLDGPTLLGYFSTPNFLRVTLYQMVCQKNVN